MASSETGGSNVHKKSPEDPETPEGPENRSLENEGSQQGENANPDEGPPETESSDETAGSEDEKQALSLEVQVEETGACQRHVTVTVSREDVERYFQEAFDELAPKAEVPGFRPGRAPRKLVEGRFRTQIAEQVKGSLVLDSMTQISEEQDFSAISEPDFDYEAVELPSEGPMTFEFDLEVRPDFDLPEWRGLEVKRPVYEITDQDVEERLSAVLEQDGQLVPYEGEVEEGDSVVLNMEFKHDGRTLSRAEEQTVRVRPRLSFHDANLEDFGNLMRGAKAGERRSAKVQISPECDVEELRGQEVDAELQVLEVKRVELPKLSPSYLERFGFETEAELRDAVRDSLARQVQYRQQQAIRRQITDQLTKDANWELPPELLKRQARRELERVVMELQSSGFSPEDIRRFSNELQQNSLATTRQALKEHFIFERIAEEEGVDAASDDYDLEIALIARSTNESPRRVRARIEKQGQMDALRNQIIERKVIGLILDHARFIDEPMQRPVEDTAAMDHAVSGPVARDIPEAKHADQPQQERLPTGRE